MNASPAASGPPTPPPTALPRGIAGRRHQGKRLFSRIFRHFPATCALLASLIAVAAPARGGDIVVTLPPLAGLVRLLDQDANVRCLLPPGAEPHDFQLAPGQADALARADLLVRASRDDGHWRGLRATRTLDLWPEIDHAWLSPREVRRALPRLARALASHAPDRRSGIEARLHQAMTLTRTIEAEWSDALAPLAGRGVLIGHGAWRRLCERFELPVLAVLESHHHGGMQPRRLEHALETLRRHPDAMLWGDARHNNRVLAWLARRTHARAVILLDALGTCGQSWAGLMRHNIARITALDGSRNARTPDRHR